MNLTPEHQAQINAQKKECIYCKINRGEIPGKKIFEDEKSLAILDIYPAKKGHTVFLFKEHYPLPAFIPPDQFKHFFGLIPGLSKALKSALVTTGINMFLAAGGPAGQQFPHMGVHLFPREPDDGFFNLMFKLNTSTDEEITKMLQTNLPIMMQNHFGRNPAEWHTGKGNIPPFLTPIYEKCTVIYEDEKAICVAPKKGAVAGHLQIYSKQEEKYIENLSPEDASHLNFVASFAATAVFEGMQAHGTNVVMVSGESDDNPEGKLILHVLPRMQDDVLKHMFWQPAQPKDDLDAMAKKIKDKTWKLSYKEKKSNIPSYVKPPVMKIGDKKEVKPSTPEDEIKAAIARMQQ
ncbi:HIT domain-containing protein [Candidatus Woesearchaeota archaeon]|nr:HIT domain-containing protein [Candidatus Woesearchaeota archaeon]